MTKHRVYRPTRRASGWRPSLLLRGPLRAALSDQGSLTARLQRACPAFNVLRLRQQQTRPYRDEVSRLKLRAGQRALIRDVLLRCDTHPLIYAHTVIPLASLRGPWHGLARLGNRPLGAALFANPRIRRHPLEYARLDARHPLYRQAGRTLGPLPTRLWARRSVFVLAGRGLLVTEVFLEEQGGCTS